ncbi:MAG: hypothetical protein Q7J16_01545 [Candidatus Cloacimonadales bacterium]|nr:hypothetical protein [Candidatus Cloacimonadales bacterium]
MKKILILIILSSTLLFGMEFDLKNKITLSGRLFENESTQNYHLNANSKPDLFVTIFGNDKFTIDTEQSLDLSYKNSKPESSENNKFDLNLYRSWFRFSTTQFELRIGKQKINFGPAQILRPLKWFDTIDPTDPQKNSEGVDALLFRYYFLNNANFWFWAIDPENIFPDHEYIQQSDGYEYGGRFQYPFKYCEAAFSYHHRDLYKDIEYPLKFDTEDRFGLDYRWDFQIGLWIETMYFALSNADSIRYNHLFTVGADYTFPIGSGLYALAEHMFYESMTADFPALFQQSSASALMFTYPIGLFDSATALVNYDWISENFFYYLSYSRSYDYLSFYLNFFWNPEYEESNFSNYYQDGKSIQLLIEMNF